MKTVEVPLVTERPSCLIQREPGQEFPIVLCVNYYINLLISHAPAELIANYSSNDPKTVIWSVVKFPENQEVHNETLPSIFYRQCLGRIAAGYMEGSLYGGFTRLGLISLDRIYAAAFYLGNDGLCGHWFRGRCSGVLNPEDAKSMGISRA